MPAGWPCARVKIVVTPSPSLPALATTLKISRHVHYLRHYADLSRSPSMGSRIPQRYSWPEMSQLHSKSWRFLAIEFSTMFPFCIRVLPPPRFPAPPLFPSSNVQAICSSSSRACTRNVACSHWGPGFRRIADQPAATPPISQTTPKTVQPGRLPRRTHAASPPPTSTRPGFRTCRHPDRGDWSPPPRALDLARPRSFGERPSSSSFSATLRPAGAAHAQEYSAPDRIRRCCCTGSFAMCQCRPRKLPGHRRLRKAMDCRDSRAFPDDGKRLQGDGHESRAYAGAHRRQSGLRKNRGRRNPASRRARLRNRKVEHAFRTDYPAPGRIGRYSAISPCRRPGSMHIRRRLEKDRDLATEGLRLRAHRIQGPDFPARPAKPPDRLVLLVCLRRKRCSRDRWAAGIQQTHIVLGPSRTADRFALDLTPARFRRQIQVSGGHWCALLHFFDRPASFQRMPAPSVAFRRNNASC